MNRYAETMRATAPSSPVVPDDTNVQSALGSLRRRGLVWQAARGVYALEDTRPAELTRMDGLIGAARAREH